MADFGRRMRERYFSAGLANARERIRKYSDPTLADPQRERMLAMAKQDEGRILVSIASRGGPFG